jgi:hypothetical protein
MAAINPPWACQGRTDHPAQLVRMAQAGVATRAGVPGITVALGGVNPYFGNRLVITGLASMNVQVDTGLVYIPNSTAWNGLYAGYNTGTFNVSLAASSATQWRQDYIVAQVTDPGDNTANWNVVAVTGTFSSSAPGSLPALPNNSVPLATVAVVPNMTVTNGGGTVSDAKLWQPLAGVQYTTSSSIPATTQLDGTMWVENDTDLLGVILGTTQRYFLTSAFKPDTWHVPAFSNSWSNQGGGLMPLQYRKEQVNKVHLIGVLNPAARTSDLFTTLPAGNRPTTGIEAPIGFHTSTGAGSGAFLRVGTDGSCSIINSGTGIGACIVNAFIPLDN